MLLKADFHIHTCLSPCASLEMSPRNIAAEAIRKGLNCIAVTDHNSALNCPAFKEACIENNIHCFFGIEAQTIEEIHCLCLFDHAAPALELSGFLYSKLPNIKNNPELLGDQVVVDSKEVIQRQVEKYLGNAAQIQIEKLMDRVHALNGLFIPAHIDRPLYGLLTQIGFLPVDDYDAVELSQHYVQNHSVWDIKNIERYKVISNSDSHDLETIGSIYNEIELDELSVKGLKRSLKDGRWKIKQGG